MKISVSGFALLLPVLLLASLSAGHGQNDTPPQTPPAAPPASALPAPQGKVTPPGAVDIANEPTVKVVANVQPAVVNITAQATVPEYVNTVDQYFRHYRGIRQHTQSSIGSGLIISAEGYVITNAHVVALADQEKEVSVTLLSGSVYKAVVVTADEDKDLALLRIEDKTTPFPYFDLSYVSPNLLGQTVIALGSPAGYQNSVSQGILSAKGRTFTVEGHTYENLIQTDAAINPGNSGGPLVDLNGGLVGINSAKLAGQAIESIGFAIPQETVIAWAHDAIEVAKGNKAPSISAATDAVRVMHDMLGISVKALTPELAAKYNYQVVGGALLITGVVEGSPAAEAQLQDGMLVIAVGTRQVANEKDLPRELLKLKAGERVRLKIICLTTVGIMTLQRGAEVMLIAK